jgi:hypothetical protein
VSAPNGNDPTGSGFTPEEIAARLELIQYAGQLDQGEAGSPGSSGRLVLRCGRATRSAATSPFSSLSSWSVTLTFVTLTESHLAQ